MEATAYVLPELLNYIDDAVDAPTVERGNMLRNPNDRQQLQAQMSCSAQRVEVALACAHAAFEGGEWENTPVTQRADVLERIAEKLEEPATRERIAYADAITTGAVINTTRRMAQLVPFIFRGAADYIRAGNLSQTLSGKAGDVEYFRRPWGPALLVSPWNGPTAIGSHKIASALAAGAPCIMKPSEWAPHSALIMAEIIHELGLPRGTFQLTCGSRHIGGQMVDDSRIRAISFTGGTAGGRVIAQACARDFKPTQLELGGNNPLVVFADANLEQAAMGITYGLTNLNAQWCRALGRILVHHSVKEMVFAAHLRYHWMENILYKPLKTFGVMILGGFEPEQAYIVHFAAITIGHLNHANIKLTWGLFKYILNNPVMHLYYNAFKLPEGKFGVNFGISLSLWDYIFKTDYIPEESGKIVLGFKGDEEIPKGLWKQITFGLGTSKPKDI